MILCLRKREKPKNLRKKQGRKELKEESEREKDFNILLNPRNHLLLVLSIVHLLFSVFG